MRTIRLFGLKSFLIAVLCTLSLAIFAASPKAADAGRFIKIVGKQDIPSETAEDDVCFIAKTAIIRFGSTNQRVNIWLATGSVAFAFDSKEEARAFLAQIADFCSKDK